MKSYFCRVPIKIKRGVLIKNLAMNCLIVLLIISSVSCSQINTQLSNFESFLKSLTNNPSSEDDGIPINVENAKNLELSAVMQPISAKSFAWLPTGEMVLATETEVVFYEPVISKKIGEPSTFTRAESKQISALYPFNLTAAKSKYLAWSTTDEKVHIWGVAEGIELFTLPVTDGKVTSLAFSPLEENLAASTFNNQIIVWNTNKGETFRHWQSSNWYSNLAFSPDGKLLAGVDLANFRVDFFDINTGERLYSLQWSDGSAPALYGAYFSPEWKWIAWVARGIVQIMSFPEGELGVTLSHEDFVNAIAWSPDSSLIATVAAGTIDGEFSPLINFWDIVSGSIINKIPLEENAVRVEFSPNGDQLAVLTNSGFVNVFSIGK